MENNKTPGKDGITNEPSHAMSDDGIDALHKLILNIWTPQQIPKSGCVGLIMSGSFTQGCRTRLVVALFLYVVIWI